MRGEVSGTVPRMPQQRNVLASGLSMFVVFGVLFLVLGERPFLKFTFAVLAIFGLIVAVVAGVARWRERRS